MSRPPGTLKARSAGRQVAAGRQRSRERYLEWSVQHIKSRVDDDLRIHSQVLTRCLCFMTGYWLPLYRVAKGESTTKEELSTADSDLRQLIDRAAAETGGARLVSCGASVDDHTLGKSLPPALTVSNHSCADIAHSVPRENSAQLTHSPYRVLPPPRRAHTRILRLRLGRTFLTRPVSSVLGEECVAPRDRHMHRIAATSTAARPSPGRWLRLSDAASYSDRTPPHRFTRDDKSESAAPAR